MNRRTMKPIPRDHSLIPIEVDGTASDRPPYLYDVVLINKGVGMSKGQAGLLRALFYMSHEDAEEHVKIAHLNQERGSRLFRSSRDVVETKVMLANRERRKAIASDPALAGVAFAMECEF